MHLWRSSSTHIVVGDKYRPALRLSSLRVGRSFLIRSRCENLIELFEHRLQASTKHFVRFAESAPLRKWRQFKIVGINRNAGRDMVADRGQPLLLLGCELSSILLLACKP